jgi:predicted molibdopterin-dependent oxidoreductase YjgC
VEIEKQRNLQPACTYPVTEGMVVRTHSSRAVEARKFALELIVSDHPLDCMTCEATGDCRLQDLAYEYGIEESTFAGGKRHEYAIDDPNPFIQVDRNKCILCRRCVRACKFINGVEAISIVERGFSSKIAFGLDSTMQDSPCEFCGSCVEVCPVAALWPKMSIGKGRPYQLRQVETVCSYCGVGCRLVLHLRGDRIVNVSGGQGPANHGFTCVKGRFGYDYVDHPDRLTKPLMRRYLVEGKAKPKAQHGGNGAGGARGSEWDWVEVSWEQALGTVAATWVATKRSAGSDAFATLCSARCTNEENYLAAKLTRQLMETHTVDHCARL